MKRIVGMLATASLASAVLASCSGSTSREIAEARILDDIKADPTLGPVVFGDVDTEAQVKDLIVGTRDDPKDSREAHVRKLMAPMLKEHIAARARHLDDRAVARIGAVLAKAILAKAAVADCTHPVSELEDEGQKQAVMIEVVNADPHFTPRTSTKEETEAYLAGQHDQIATHAGVSPADLEMAYGGQTAVSHEMTCRILGGSILTLLDLPPADGVPMIRVLIDF